MKSKQLLRAALLSIGGLTGIGSTQAQTLAFPGALGFGANVTGGRTGSVYHVTNLNNSGTGSFRDAVSTANRLVVFDVGGYITLTTSVAVKSNITIAGQTAPGGGIGIKGAEVSFGSQSNIIMRHVRVRPGASAPDTDNGINLYQTHDAILDHVSVEFASWNNIDSTTGDWQNKPVNDITVQNSIIANPIGQQFGAHTEAVDGTWSWFNNIFANSHNRNPLAKINTVFINNVLYNCDAGYTTHTSTNFKHDIKNNYFIAGPASGGNMPWFQIDNNQSIYSSGNLKDSALDGALGGSGTNPLPGYQGGGTVLSSPWSTITTGYPAVSPASAYRRAISQTGALPLDQVDSLVVSQVKTLGSGTTGTSAGTRGPGGGLYTSEAQTGLGNGGFGSIATGTKPTDTDNDGMPDFWEKAFGWNVSGADSMIVQSNGYARLESYINWLADPHVTGTGGTNIDLSLTQFAGGFVSSPTYSVSAPVNGTVTLVNGSTARFTPAAGFAGLASYKFTVTDSAGSTMTLTAGVLVQPGAVTAPSVPTGITAKAGNAKASVSWNASANATSYTIKRATTSGGPYTNIATNSYTTNYLDTGLSNGTTYYYVVSAANGGGSSANSSQASAAPGAAASITLQAEDSVLGGDTTVSTNTAGYNGTGYANYPVDGGTTTFNNVNGGTGGTAQLVIRFGLTGTDARTGTLTVNGVTQNLVFPSTVEWTNWSTIAVNVTLNAGTGNTLVIASTGEDLASVDEMTVIPTGGSLSAPSAPASVTAKAGNAKASVSWNASANATSYTIKRATTSGGPYTNIATNSYTTNFLDTGLTNGTTYYYVVSASNGGGSSANSSQVSAAPGAAASITLQAEDSVLGGGTAVSTNTAGYNGTGYANYPADAGTTTFNNVPGGTGGTAQLVLRFGLTGTDARTGTLTVNGVAQNLVFPPTVDWLNWSTIAVNVTLNAGTGNTLVIASTGADLASVDEITVIPTGGISSAPAAPIGLGATAANAQVSLSWTASSGATSYNVKRATTSGGPYTTVSSPSGTSYTDTGLANGTTYYYVVSAVNGGGESANSSQASATPQPPAPAAPTGLAATAGNAQVSLTWTASSGATGYNIKRATVSGGPYTTISSPTGTSYVNTGLTNGTTYYYVVAAVNGGGESANSSQSSATPQPPVPAAPAGLAATAGNTQVSLTWTASSGATSYNVKRAATSGGPYTTVSSPTGTSYVNTGLTNGTTYYYVVSAVNGGGESANSSQTSATPQPPIPSTPTGLAATAGNAQVLLAWGASSGATSYNVKRATTSGGPYTAVSSPTGTSYVNTGLTNGTTYYYVVTAANGGGESANSSQVSVTPAVPILSGLLIHEGFGYTSGTSIANQTGGFGWGANWSNTGNAQDVSAAQAASLASGTLLGTGGSVKFGPSSAGGSTSSGVYMRQFASTVGSMAASGSGSVWLSLLYLNSTSSVDASGFYGEARIGLYAGVTATGGVTQTAGATQVVNTGTPATSATVLDRISLYNGATINATSVATPRGTTPALLLLKVVADNTAAADTVYLWVNPNLANGEPAIATANASWTTSDLSGVNGLRFQQAGTNGGVVTNIDEIRLGRTFGDVSPSSTLPSPWATADIGSVAAAGSAGHSAGVFTVAGSGSGIAGTADEFRSVHQAASGDCSIVARVTAVQNTGANAKAGVSIRESAGATAAQATCAVANGTVSFIYRSATGGATTTVPVSGVNPPCWVRLDRAGDTFTAAYSADGITWTTVGSTTITMATNVSFGTVVTSQADGTLTTSSIDNVTATP